METNTTHWQRFRRDPLGMARRVLYKLFVGPLKYRRGDRYDAPRYWSDRFAKYGTSLLGPGDEGLSEEQNLEMYRRAEADFLGLCAKEGVDLPNARVLEIGLGNGFYTDVLRRAGVTRYLGADITDVLFSEFRTQFPGYGFVRADITTEELPGPHDAIFLIDVIQHIVTEEQLGAALRMITDRLAPGGTFVVGPLSRTSEKHLYYVHSWSLETVDRLVAPGLTRSGPYPFRNGELYVYRRPA